MDSNTVITIVLSSIASLLFSSGAFAVLWHGYLKSVITTEINSALDKYEKERSNNCNYRHQTFTQTDNELRAQLKVYSDSVTSLNTKVDKMSKTLIRIDERMRLTSKTRSPDYDDEP